MKKITSINGDYTVRVAKSCELDQMTCDYCSIVFHPPDKYEWSFRNYLKESLFVLGISTSLMFSIGVGGVVFNRTNILAVLMSFEIAVFSVS